MAFATLGERAFSGDSRNLWNSLPDDIVKMRLFKVAFKCTIENFTQSKRQDIRPGLFLFFIYYYYFLKFVI